MPTQIDLYNVDDGGYKFLHMTRDGGLTNKAYLYQETKALVTPMELKGYLVERMHTFDTATCPPYRVAFVVGGTSTEATPKAMKLASTRYYDGLPTKGNGHG